jgi:transcriptional regulator with XRE-family HTH domain
MNYFERLKLCRKIIGLSQTQMGELFGLPQTTYSNYENGSRELPVEILGKLIQYGFNSDWLITGKIIEDYHEYLQACNNNSPLPITEISQALNVPAKFIQAIINGEISPTETFYKRLLAAMKNENMPEAVNSLNENNAQYQCSATVSFAESEIAALKTEISTLRNEVMQHSGKTETYNDLIQSTLGKVVELLERMEK